MKMSCEKEINGLNPCKICGSKKMIVNKPACWHHENRCAKCGTILKSTKDMIESIKLWNKTNPLPAREKILVFFY